VSPWAIVLLTIVVILVLVGFIPLGVEAAWEEGHFSFFLRVWCVSIGTKKKEKPQKDEKASASPPEDKERPSQKKGLPSWPVLKILAENGYNTLCRLVCRVQVDVLKIHFTAAFSDPSVTAMAYASAGVAMEGLLRLGGKRISHPDLRAMVDFDREKPLVVFRIRLTLRVYQLLGAALGFGFSFLRDFIRLKKKKG
jgi:hypothetical protein